MSYNESVAFGIELSRIERWLVLIFWLRRSEYLRGLQTHFGKFFVFIFLLIYYATFVLNIVLKVQLLEIIFDTIWNFSIDFIHKNVDTN